MPLRPLKFLSEAMLERLRTDIAGNEERYSNGDFLDLERGNGWSVEARTVQVDYDALKRLDGNTSDIAGSRIVYESLRGMTPALAREERVWVRMTHVECLAYSRARWLSKAREAKPHAAVRKHLFAAGWTGVRDDNAVSRLWWNMHIATIADPADPAGALSLIARNADIRQAIVERPGTAARRPVARALVRAMRRDPWITSTEQSFREFMKALNRDGSGVLFEALDDGKMDAIIAHCVTRARSA